MSEKFHENVRDNELDDVVELVGEESGVLKFYHIGTIKSIALLIFFYQTVLIKTFNEVRAQKAARFLPPPWIIRLVFQWLSAYRV